MKLIFFLTIRLTYIFIMKIINSVLSFCFGIYLLIALVYVNLNYFSKFNNSYLESIDFYLIIIFNMLFFLYSMLNLVLAFRKKRIARNLRIFMIIMHLIMLIFFTFFSFFQYSFMNLINIAINIMVNLCLIFLLIYLIRYTKLYPH